MAGESKRTYATKDLDIEANQQEKGPAREKFNEKASKGSPEHFPNPSVESQTVNNGAKIVEKERENTQQREAVIRPQQAGKIDFKSLQNRSKFTSDRIWPSGKGSPQSPSGKSRNRDKGKKSGKGERGNPQQLYRLSITNPRSNPTIGIAYPQQKVSPPKKLETSRGPVSGSYRFHVPSIPEREAELQQEELNYNRCFQESSSNLTSPSYTSQAHPPPPAPQQQPGPLESNNTQSVSQILFSDFHLGGADMWQSPDRTFNNSSFGVPSQKPNNAMDVNKTNGFVPLSFQYGYPLLDDAASDPFSCDQNPQSQDFIDASLVSNQVPQNPFSFQSSGEEHDSVQGNAQFSNEQLENRSPYTLHSKPPQYSQTPHGIPSSVHCTRAVVEDSSNGEISVSSSHQSDQNKGSVHHVRNITQGQSSQTHSRIAQPWEGPNKTFPSPMEQNSTPYPFQCQTPLEQRQNAGINSRMPWQQIHLTSAMPNQNRIELSRQLSNQQMTFLLNPSDWQEDSKSQKSNAQKSSNNFPSRRPSEAFSSLRQDSVKQGCSTIPPCQFTNKVESIQGQVTDPKNKSLYFGLNQTISGSSSRNPNYPQLQVPTMGLMVSPYDSPSHSPIQNPASSSTCSSRSPESTSPANSSSDDSQNALHQKVPPPQFFHQHQGKASSDTLNSNQNNYHSEVPRSLHYNQDRAKENIPYGMEHPPPPPYSAHQLLASSLATANLDQLDVLLTCKQCDQNFNNLASFLDHKQYCGQHSFAQNDFKDPRKVEDTRKFHIMPDSETKVDAKDDPMKLMLPSAPLPDLEMEDAKLDSLITEALNGLGYQSDNAEIDSSFIDAFVDDEITTTKCASNRQTLKTKDSIVFESRSKHEFTSSEKSLTREKYSFDSDLDSLSSESKQADILHKECNRGADAHEESNKEETSLVKRECTSEESSTHTGWVKETRRSDKTAEESEHGPRFLLSKTFSERCGLKSLQSSTPLVKTALPQSPSATRSPTSQRPAVREGKRKRASGGSWSKELIHKIVQQKNKEYDYVSDSDEDCEPVKIASQGRLSQSIRCKYTYTKECKGRIRADKTRESPWKQDKLENFEPKKSEAVSLSPIKETSGHQRVRRRSSRSSTSSEISTSVSISSESISSPKSSDRTDSDCEKRLEIRKIDQDPFEQERSPQRILKESSTSLALTFTKNTKHFSTDKIVLSGLKDSYTTSKCSNVISTSEETASEHTLTKSTVKPPSALENISDVSSVKDAKTSNDLFSDPPSLCGSLMDEACASPAKFLDASQQKDRSLMSYSLQHDQNLIKSPLSFDTSTMFGDLTVGGFDNSLYPDIQLTKESFGPLESTADKKELFESSFSPVFEQRDWGLMVDVTPELPDEIAQYKEEDSGTTNDKKTNFNHNPFTLPEKIMDFNPNLNSVSEDELEIKRIVTELESQLQTAKLRSPSPLDNETPKHLTMSKLSPLRLGHNSDVEQSSLDVDCSSESLSLGAPPDSHPELFSEPDLPWSSPVQFALIGGQQCLHTPTHSTVADTPIHLGQDKSDTKDDTDLKVLSIEKNPALDIEEKSESNDSLGTATDKSEEMIEHEIYTENLMKSLEVMSDSLSSGLDSSQSPLQEKESSAAEEQENDYHEKAEPTNETERVDAENVAAEPAKCSTGHPKRLITYDIYDSKLDETLATEESVSVLEDNDHILQVEDKQEPDKNTCDNASSKDGEKSSDTVHQSESPVVTFEHKNGEPSVSHVEINEVPLEPHITEDLNPNHLLGYPDVHQDEKEESNECLQQKSSQAEDILIDSEMTENDKKVLESPSATQSTQDCENKTDKTETAKNNMDSINGQVLHDVESPCSGDVHLHEIQENDRNKVTAHKQPQMENDQCCEHTSYITFSPAHSSCGDHVQNKDEDSKLEPALAMCPSPLGILQIPPESAKVLEAKSPLTVCWADIGTMTPALIEDKPSLKSKSSEELDIGRSLDNVESPATTAEINNSFGPHLDFAETTENKISNPGTILAVDISQQAFSEASEKPETLDVPQYKDTSYEFKLSPLNYSERHFSHCSPETINHEMDVEPNIKSSPKDSLILSSCTLSTLNTQLSSNCRLSPIHIQNELEGTAQDHLVQLNIPHFHDSTSHNDKYSISPHHHVQGEDAADTEQLSKIPKDDMSSCHLTLETIDYMDLHMNVLKKADSDNVDRNLSPFELSGSLPQRHSIPCVQETLHSIEQHPAVSISLTNTPASTIGQCAKQSDIKFSPKKSGAQSTVQGKFQCEICLLYFRTVPGLKRHKAMKHTLKAEGLTVQTSTLSNQEYAPDYQKSQSVVKDLKESLEIFDPVVLLHPGDGVALGHEGNMSLASVFEGTGNKSHISRSINSNEKEDEPQIMEKEKKNCKVKRSKSMDANNKELIPELIKQDTFSDELLTMLKTDILQAIASDFPTMAQPECRKSPEKLSTNDSPNCEEVKAKEDHQIMDSASVQEQEIKHPEHSNQGADNKEDATKTEGCAVLETSENIGQANPAICKEYANAKEFLDVKEICDTCEDPTVDIKREMTTDDNDAHSESYKDPSLTLFDDENTFSQLFPRNDEMKRKKCARVYGKSSKKQKPMPTLTPDFTDSSVLAEKNEEKKEQMNGGFVSSLNDYCEYETIVLDDAKMLEMCHKSSSSAENSLPPSSLQLVCVQDNATRHANIDIQNLNTTFQLPEIQFFEPGRDISMAEDIASNNTQIKEPETLPKKPTERKGRKRIETGLKPKNKQYKCKVCFTWFLTLGELDFHKLSHNPSPPPTCYMCVQRKFSSREQLRDHLREKHAKNKAGVWTCGMCLKEISDVWMYNEHLREHATQFARKGQSQSSLLDMPGCFMQENAVKNFLSSIMQHRSNRSTKGENAKSSRDERKASVEALGVEQKSLDVCESATPKPKTSTGGGSKHATLTPCEVLQKAETAPKNVEIHPNCKDPSRDCHHCGKQFPKPFKLQRHLVVHSLQKIFMCHKCPVSYQEAKELKDHLTNEHEEADELDSKHTTLLTCELCADVMHVIKKSFICSTCNYTFSKKEQFDRHMEKHLAGGNKIFKFRGVGRPCKPFRSKDEEFDMPPTKRRKVLSESSQENSSDSGIASIGSIHLNQTLDTQGLKSVEEDLADNNTEEEQSTDTNNTSVKIEDVPEELSEVLEDLRQCQRQMDSAEDNFQTKSAPMENDKEYTYTRELQDVETRDVGTDNRTSMTESCNVKIEEECGAIQTSQPLPVSDESSAAENAEKECPDLENAVEMMEAEDSGLCNLLISDQTNKSTKSQQAEGSTPNEDCHLESMKQPSPSSQINQHKQDKINEQSSTDKNENEKDTNPVEQLACTLLKDKATSKSSENMKQNLNNSPRSGSLGATDGTCVSHAKIPLSSIMGEDKDSIKHRKRKELKITQSSQRTASSATRENLGFDNVKKKFRPNKCERAAVQRKVDVCGDYPVLTSVKDDAASNKIVSKHKAGTLSLQPKRSPLDNFSPKKGEVVRHLNGDCRGRKGVPGRPIHSPTSKVSVASLNNSFNKSRPKPGVKSVETHSYRTAESQNNLLSKLFGQRLTGFKIPLRKDTSESIN
uniref:C2H2-type domain-containing protein n=1 Tax=Astyanax mexicanus TaxID=7994 RepID=A0A3B1JFD6_ASTMX